MGIHFRAAFEGRFDLQLNVARLDMRCFRLQFDKVLISNRLRFAMIIVIAVSTIGLTVRFVPDLNWIVERETWLRNSIATAPVTSYLVGMVLYTGLSLIPGTAGKSIVVGWLFGFVTSVFLVEIGLTTAAILSFLMGRYLVQQMLHRRWQIYLRWISHKFAQSGAFYLIWLRMAHAPFTLVNYGAGAANIPLATFWWTTHVGILPATLVFTFVGARIPNIRTVVERGVLAVVDPPLFITLFAIAFSPILIAPWVRKRASKK
jgi:uncharacterized membrane protein YdjX (TVP38/TMEM64 family)